MVLMHASPFPPVFTDIAMHISCRTLTTTLLGAALALAAGLCAAKTYPAGGNVAALTLSKNSVAAGENVTFTVTGIGKCAVRLQGFPGATSPMLRGSGALPLLFTASISQPGTYSVSLDVLHDNTDPMWCTGAPGATLTVHAAVISQAIQTVPGGLGAVLPGAMASGDKLTMPDRIGAYGAIVKLQAVLAGAGDGKPVANAMLTFKVNGAPVGQASTGADGAAELDYAVPEGLAPGSHNMEATGASAGISAHLTVLKGATQLSMELGKPLAPLIEPGMHVILRGRLLGPGTPGAPIAGRSIALRVNNKAAGEAVTNAQGGYEFNYDATTVGTHSALVGFDGDGHHLPSAPAQAAVFNVVPQGAKVPPPSTVTPKQTLIGDYRQPPAKTTTATQVFVGQY